LNATDYPSYTTGYLFFYQAASVTGSFLVSDYFGYRYTYETVTGEFLLMSGADSLAMVPITNATKYVSSKKQKRIELLSQAAKAKLNILM